MSQMMPEGSGYTPSMFSSLGLGMEYLGGGELAAPSNRIGPIYFRPRDVLFVITRITGITGANDFPAVRFNTDTSATYWDRNLSAAASASLWTNTPNASTTMVRLGSVAGLSPSLGMLVIMNRRTSTKSVIGELATSTGSAATAGPLQIVVGEWINTTNQIQAIEVMTAGGVATFNADSGFGVLGKDLP